METLLADVRYAVRSLRRRPAFAGGIIVTLAIAIGATTLMMGVVNSAIIRPLPLRDAGQLVFAQGFVGREQQTRSISFLEARDWQTRSRAFDGLAIYEDVSLNVADVDGNAWRVEAEIVSANYFRVLGTPPARGRAFLPEEDRVPDAHAVAVVSDRFWRARLDGGDSVIGRPLVIDGRPFTIVGVMPTGFRGLSFAADIWIPTMMVSTIRPVSTLENRTSRWLRVVGRLKPSVSLVDAQRDLDRVAAELAREYPETNTDRGARVTSLRDTYLGTTRVLLFALLGAAAFLLLIACANVTSLQLVRAASRRREVALRVALGAGQHRLVRQMLTEAVVLAIAGAAAGVLLAFWGIDVLLALAPAGLLPSYVDVALDARVLAAAVLLTLIAGVVFGIAPAISASRTNLVTSLKDGAPSATAGLGSMRRMRSQQVFVIGEVALALVLATGAMLMVRSLGRQLDVDPGFRAEGVIAARLSLPLDRYGRAERARFAAQLVERARAIPGVSGAAVGADLPLRGLQSGGYLTYDGSSAEGVRYARHRVSPEYFETLGIPLRRGRTFASTDGPDAPQVAIVNASAAERLWPGRDPIAQRIHPAGTDGPLSMAIVGVVGDVRFRDLTSDLRADLATADIYFPFAQETDETLEIALRGQDQRTMIAGLRAAVRDLDRTLPLFEIASIGDAVAEQTASARFGAGMLSAVAAIAVLLAAIGIYSLLSFVVGSSTRDIAIRMAVGAASANVIALVIRRGISLTVAGVLLGIALAVSTLHVLSDFLFGVRASDPITMGAVALMLGAIAILASWLPARRASLISPLSILKGE